MSRGEAAIERKDMGIASWRGAHRRLRDVSHPSIPPSIPAGRRGPGARARPCARRRRSCQSATTPRHQPSQVNARIGLQARGARRADTAGDRARQDVVVEKPIALSLTAPIASSARPEGRRCGACRHAALQGSDTVAKRRRQAVVGRFVAAPRAVSTARAGDRDPEAQLDATPSGWMRSLIKGSQNWSTQA